MLNKSSKLIKANLYRMLENVGDMALWRRAVEIVENLEIKPTDKVIDIGAGNGYYLYLLRKIYGLKLRLVGVDPDRRALQAAQKLLPTQNLKLVVSDASCLGFANASFDKAVMSEVIEHVDNPALVLTEVHRILKSSGILVLTTPNRNFPFMWDPVNWVLQKLGNTHIKQGFWAGIWNQHPRLYTPSEIQTLITHSGFKVVQIRLLTYWCMPFNHYLVNLFALLLYGNYLPQPVADAVNKFKTAAKPWWIKLAFGIVNVVDRLNDVVPLNRGVSIFIVAQKT